MTKKPTTEKLLNLLDDKYKTIGQDREVHLEGLLHSNLIISDNQIAPLNAFKNVILMGSFIWHDLVESKDKDYKRIIALEKKLLIKNKPTIICLENMAMDNLFKYTNPVFSPWFTKKHKHQSVKKQKKSILITGGGTKFQDLNLINISKYILKLDKKIIIYLDNSKIYLVIFSLRGNK